jgi:hypothetical protein
MKTFTTIGTAIDYALNVNYNSGKIVYDIDKLEAGLKKSKIVKLKGFIFVLDKFDILT